MGETATAQSGCIHFQAGSCQGEKKKAAACRFWQKCRRPQMHLPARPRCSLCLCPSGLLRSALAFILPADFSQRGDRRLGEVRHQGRNPGVTLEKAATPEWFHVPGSQNKWLMLIQTWKSFFFKSSLANMLKTHIFT